MKRLFYILLFVFSFLFYWGSGLGIENRTEAEDVFEYALMVEQGAEHAWFYHEHHLLYGSLMRTIYEMAQALGYDGRAIEVMRLISALCAAGTLFFFFLFCYKRYSLRPVSSLLATVFLAVCYGFWRYSAESEIPLVASFFVSAAFYFSTNEDARRRPFVLAVIFSTLAVLIHIMNAVAVFVAVPAFYLIRKRWKLMVWHILLCVVLCAGVYTLIGMTTDVHGKGIAHFSMIGFGDLAKAVVAFVQCVISSDFMLGFRSIRAFLSELFAGRMLLEEFYFGERLSRYYVLGSTLTYFTFFVLMFGCIGRAAWVWKNIIAERDRYRLPRGVGALVAPALFFLGYGGLLLFLEPGNPELWWMGLMPFALLLCGLVLLPLTVDNKLWLPFLMVLSLMIHNGNANRMLYDSTKDYQYRKSRAVMDLSVEGDLIVTAGSPVFERYLRYHSSSSICYLYELGAEELAAEDLPETEGRIYVLGDVFKRNDSLRIRFPEKTAEIELFAERIWPQVEQLEHDVFGGLYILER